MAQGPRESSTGSRGSSSVPADPPAPSNPPSSSSPASPALPSVPVPERLRPILQEFRATMQKPEMRHLGPQVRALQQSPIAQELAKPMAKLNSPPPPLDWHEIGKKFYCLRQPTQAQIDELLRRLQEKEPPRSDEAESTGWQIKRILKLLPDVCSDTEFFNLFYKKLQEKFAPAFESRGWKLPDRNSFRRAREARRDQLSGEDPR